MRQHQAQRWEIDAVSGINAPKSEKKAWMEGCICDTSTRCDALLG